VTDRTPDARAPEPGISWPPWLPADGSGGVPHLDADGVQCPENAIIACSRCQWVDSDESRALAALDLFGRIRPAVLGPQQRAGMLRRWQGVVMRATGGRRD
jgi:hypothetical protein